MLLRVSERLADNAFLQVAEAAPGHLAALLDRRQQARPQLGMRRLDSPGEPKIVAGRNPRRPEAKHESYEGNCAQSDRAKLRIPTGQSSEPPDQRTNECSEQPHHGTAAPKDKLPIAEGNLVQLIEKLSFDHATASMGAICRAARPASQVSRISTPSAATISQRQSFWRLSSSVSRCWRICLIFSARVTCCP